METKVKNDPVVAIAGVTGAVGAEFIATMDRRAFRVGKRWRARGRQATPSTFAGKRS
jgi:aspartate-semialdehyde dehydrogenase